jgi:hypothetical protein
VFQASSTPGTDLRPDQNVPSEASATRTKVLSAPGSHSSIEVLQLVLKSIDEELRGEIGKTDMCRRQAALNMTC